LNNQTLGMAGVNPLQLTAIEPIFHSRKNDSAKAMSLMELTFTQKFAVVSDFADCAGLLPDAGMLEQINNNFYLQPDVNHDNAVDLNALVVVNP
jgi:hypothetical protein